MFLSFLMPFVDRGQGPIFQSLMLRQVAAFGPQQLALVADGKYFGNVAAPWEQELNSFGFRFRCPSQSDFEDTPRFVIPDSVFTELAQRSGSMLDAFRILLTEDYPPLREALQKVFRDVSAQQKLEAALTWCNVPSLSRVAAEFNVPVIHNELGPLREPLYQNTIYFDWKGVNGRTSAEAEMHRFVWESRRQPNFRPLGLEAIRKLFRLEKPAPASRLSHFAAGAALQVEDDSNLLAFGKGWNNFELIFAARKGRRPAEVLMRKHPRGYADYSAQLATMDDSPDSVRFLERCEELFTINSSLAFESLLHGKPVTILGDSPAAGLSRERFAAMTPETQLLCLNYLFLCYLVPASLLYDAEYYRWRLQRPGFSQLYGRHLALLAQSRSGEVPPRSSQRSFSSPKEIPVCAANGCVTSHSPATSGARKILFVSHDASRTGAPMFLLNFIRWWRQQSPLPFRIVLRNGGPLETEFRALGETILANEVSDPQELCKDVALVYSNTCTNGPWLRQLPLSNIPVLTHIHELDYVIDWFGQDNFRQTVQQSSHFIACAEAVARGLQEQQGIPADQITVVHEGVPVDIVTTRAAEVSPDAMRQRLRLSHDAIVVCACGGADWRKGPDIFLQLADGVRRQLAGSVPVQFVWIGLVPPDDRGRILRRDQRLLNLCDDVEFVGEQANPYPYLNTADIFCLCSREDPFPLVMLEAGVLNKPTVCFEKAGGAPEFCARGGGFTVPYLNVEAMADRVVDLVRNENLRRESGASAARAVAEFFSMEVVGPKIATLITQWAQPTAAAAATEIVSWRREAETAIALQDYQTAEACLRRALEQGPNDFEALLDYGELLCATGNLPGAHAQFVQAAAVQPGNASVHAHLGMVLVRMERLPEAEETLRRALAINARELSTLRLMASICLRQCRYVEAADFCSQVLRQSPRDVEALVAQARCHLELDHHVLAELLFEQALEMQPNHQEARVALAELRGEEVAADSGADLTRRYRL